MSTHPPVPTPPNPDADRLIRLLFEQAFDGIFLADASGRYFAVNPSGRRMLGYTAAELSGMSAERVVLPEDVGRLRDVFRGLAEDATHVGRWTLVRKDGSRFEADIVAQGLGPDVAFAVVRDATERRAAENALAAAGARLRALVDALPEPAFVLDRDLRVVVCNEALARSLGAPQERLVGSEILRFVSDPAAAASRRERVLRVFATGRAEVFEDVNGPRHFRNSFVPVRDASGEVSGVAVFALDLTDLRRASLALAAGEARLKATVENTPDVAIQWYDVDGRVRFWNPASERMFGYPASVAVGRTLDELIHTPEEFVAFKRVLAEIAATGAPAGPDEYPFRRRDGSTGSCWSTIFRIPGEGDRPYFVCMDVDLTPRRAAEAARARSDERLELALRGADLGLWDFDARSGLMTFDERTRAMLGAPEGVFEAPRDVWFSYVHPEDREAALAACELHIAGGSTTFESLRRMRADDGPWRWIQLRGRAVERDAAGRGVRASGTALDATERKLIEARLAESQRVESVGRLAGGVAHDFNNVLTSVLGFAELAADANAPPAERAKSLAQIVAAAERGAALTQQLLAFARRKIVRPETLDLDDVVARLLPMLERLMGKDCRVVHRRTPGLGKARLDLGGVEQVIVNLATNARDARPRSGTIVIETANVVVGRGAPGDADAPPAGDYVALTVIDDGDGVAPEAAGRLFEPFFTTKAPGKGTGLGLSVCDGIVRQAGGRILVDSRPGEGSRFRALFPRHEGASEARPAPAAAPASPKPSRPGPTRVLVVDDDEDVRRLMVRALEKAGCAVAGVADAAAALASTPAPDVLVTDVEMPDMSGTELARRLAAARPDVRVLLTSGHTEKALRLLHVRPDRVAFLAKPFTPAQLIEKVLALGAGASAAC